MVTGGAIFCLNVWVHSVPVSAKTSRAAASRPKEPLELRSVNVRNAMDSVEELVCLARSNTSSKSRLLRMRYKRR